MSQGTPTTAGNRQKLDRQGRILPGTFGVGTAPQTPGFQTPGLQMGRVKCYCFQLPNLWLGNDSPRTLTGGHSSSFGVVERNVPMTPKKGSQPRP